MTALSGVIKGVVRRGDAARGALIGDGAAVHDGISFNAATGKTYTKVTGASPTLGTLTSLFTFMGGNQSYYRGPSGLLLASVTNTPRIEYDASGAVIGFLVEASRTNKGLNSEDLSAAGWAGSAGNTISVNAIAAPDGNVTADKMVEDGSVGEHRRRQTIVTTLGSTVTVSIFAKAAENPRINIRALDGAVPADLGTATFDMTTGTLVGSSAGGAGTLLATSITPYANGWYRCTLTIKPNATMISCIVDIFEVDGSTTTTNYAGDSVSGNYLWGFQFEEAAFASSYIPTTAASVTRTSDVCTRTLGSEFSATAGTVVVTGRASGGQSATTRQPICCFDDGTTANRIPIVRPTATDVMQLRIDTATVNQTAIGDTVVNSASYKLATAWALNDSAFVYNAGVLQTDNTVTLPVVTGLGLGYEQNTATQMNGWIRTFDYYPTRLTNEQLQMRST